ncbi:MAG TPA: TIGR03435 family protein [Bryobacteraceae bacterium]|nr:TIGR03435 family protein [Bryobacteraceae bacterium]
MRRSFACGILMSFALWGADLPSFDVASVRPGSHPVTKEGYSFSSARRSDPTRFRALNCDLSELIEEAYGVRADRISGPDDVHSHAVTFDIDGTMPAETTDAQMKLMLRHLLAERFRVALHSVTTPKSGYSLVLDRGGPKLKPSALEHSPGVTSYGGSGVHLISPAVRMDSLANALSRDLGVPVIDQTHIDGLYVLDIQFSKFGTDSNLPTVFEAVKSLGLRLDKAEIPIESIIVDHANFKPTAN